MAVVQVYNSVGIIKDMPAHYLPPEAWSDGNNMRIIDGCMHRWLGHQAVLGTPSISPGFIFHVPAINDSFWIYAGLTSAHATDGVSHDNITRGAGPYTTTNLRDWNGCLLGGVPIINNGNDVPQYWPNLALGTDLANMTNWPATLRAKVIRNFGSFLVALNLVDGGVALPHALRWSHPADPGTLPPSWDVADPARDAGQRHLTDTKGGELLDAYLLGNYLILYKRSSTHIMRFIGGSEVFGLDMLFEQGLLAPRCAAGIDGGSKHFCVSKDDIFVHSGTKAVEYPLHRKDRRYLFNDISTTLAADSFVFDNPQFEEVWFVYATAGAALPNKALVWNYRTGEPTFRDFPGISASLGFVAESGLGSYDSSSGPYNTDFGPYNKSGIEQLVVADPRNDKLWSLDSGLSFGGVVSTAYVQRTGWAIVGRDRSGNPKADFQNEKLFSRIWPKIKGSAVVEIRLGSQEEFDGPVTWAPYKQFDPVQKYLDFEVVGRYGAIEARSSSDIDWQIDGIDVDVEIISDL